MSDRRGVSYANTWALWILAAVAALYFLRSARDLLIPIALGVVLSYALEPVVVWLQRYRVPRLAGASLVMVALLGGLAWGGWLMRDDALELAKSLPEAADKAREMVSAQLGDTVPIEQAAGLGGGRGSAEPSAPTGTSGQEPAGGAGSFAQRAAAALFDFSGQLLVVVFLLFFQLISGPFVRNKLVEISGHDAERRRTIDAVIGDINEQIQRFLLVRLVTAVIVGAATWLVLAWMGVEHAAVWGGLAGLFNSIPYFGPVIVSGGLLVVGLVQDGDITRALQMSGAALVITSLEGWLLTPPLMGKAERMSALAVFLGLLLWTWVWGAWGTILAVPMLVVMKSVGDHVKPLNPLGRLLAP